VNGPCVRQQELIEQVQQHLIRLSELARREASLVATEEEAVWLAVDKEIENELGEKERALGALREHQREHGC
jgi:hypothetical protein